VRVASIIAAGTIAATMVACHDPVAPTSDVLTATRAALPGFLRLENRTGDPVFYIVTERNAHALADYVFCADPSCPSVPARGSISVSYGKISGYHAGASEAVVLHWRLQRQQDGSYAPDSIRSIVAPL
jgi:hypothetical protein